MCQVQNENNIRQFHKITKAKPDTVLLIGVGRGDDLLIWKELYPHARFIGVEPLREHIKALRKLWKWSTSDLLRVAVGAANGVRTLHCNYEPDQRATFYPMLTPLPDEETREVDVITLDEFHFRTRPWGQKVLMWIDIEGAEAEAFSSVEKPATLEKVRWINTESTFMTSRPDACLHCELEQELGEVGFQLFAIHSLTRNGRQCDAVYVPRAAWREQVHAVSVREVKRKKDRLQRRARLVRARRRRKKNEASKTREPKKLSSEKIQAHSGLTTWFGARHVSFDWNGKHGSIVLDLGRRIGGHKRRTRWMETFDIATNFGTIEHVENGQYWAFRNLHDLCRPGGYMLHVPPREGTCKGHGFWTYTTEWFEWLAQACSYDIMVLREFDLSQSWKRYKPGAVVYILVILGKSQSELLLTGGTDFVARKNWINPTLETNLPRRRSQPIHSI